jgi:tight adherence protein B
VTALLAVLGAGIGAGVWLLVWGLARTDNPRRPSRLGRAFPDLPVRVTAAVFAAVVALAVTRWAMAALAAFALGFFARDLFGQKGKRAAGVDRSVAVASWAEMLRDTLSASSGLEDAIGATAPLSAPSIRPALIGLVSRFGRMPLADALASFADELADPTADLVVSALILAARGEAQHLSDLLSALAESAREDATMRLRVDASRARTRTAVRVIAAVTVIMVAGLLLLNRSYLQPYDSLGGQAVLGCVFATFAAGLGWLQVMSRYQAPDRFLARRHPEEEP